MRETPGLSQTRFADLIGISPRTLQNREQPRKGTTRPNMVLDSEQQAAEWQEDLGAY